MLGQACLPSGEWAGGACLACLLGLLAWNEHKMCSDCCSGIITGSKAFIKKCFMVFEWVSPALPLADFITDCYTVFIWKSLCDEDDSTFDCIWWKLGKADPLLLSSMLLVNFLTKCEQIIKKCIF